jgi:hypothetical protein
MSVINKLLVNQKNNFYLLEDVILDGECLSNYSLIWISANCKNYNPVIYSVTFFIISRFSLIISHIDFDLTNFNLKNNPLITAFSTLEMYFVKVSGGERIRSFTSSIIAVFLVSTSTLSGCEFSNIYVYCNQQLIYFGLYIFFFVYFFFLN